MYSALALPIAATLFANAGMSSPIARAANPEFQLIVNSSDGSGRYVDSSVAACHSGAATEALCILPNLSDEFTFNATSPGTSSPGRLIYDEPAEPQNVSQALQLYYPNASSNIGYAFFGAGSGPIELGIAEDNKQLGVNVDTGDGSVQTQYLWYVCEQTTLGYTYETVSFVKDFAAPSDPSCAQVFLFQKFGAN